ncbi:PAS domain-containing protein [Novosphingobium terrae]|jgi:PAS domain S-box-containing protein|uniref:PAS domain-containing protein n=1 Tax=Novosphingobium terrae TaxID=2726189 RepID=UPI00197E0776|nr:PAS domain-containing protein [Novosphingobium terrae]
MPLTDLIDHSAVAAIICDARDPDLPIISCNSAFIALTGYERDEIVGRNCRFLRGPDTDPAVSQQLREAIRANQPTMVEILNYRKDGTPFRNAVMVAPLFDEAGQVEYFLGSQVDVTGRGVVAEVKKSMRAAARDIIARLSRRQHQILVEMAAGKLNKQIAWDLDLSERTIKMHRSAMFRALGVRTSADAIRLAVEAGL